MKHSVREVTLSNHVKGLVIEVPGSSVINARLVVNAGFLYVPRRLAELPHVMEHVIFGANSAYKSMKEVEIAFEKNGAYSNAFTAEHYIGYDAEAADFEASRILELLGTCASTPKFLDEELSSELGNVKEELNNRFSDHGTTSYFNLERAMLGRRTDQDGLKSLPAIDRQSLVDFHKRTHLSENTHFILAGNVTSKAIDSLERGLSKLPTGKSLPFPVESPKHLDKAVVLPRDIPQIYYTFKQFSPLLENRDRLAAWLIRTILTGRYDSWIFGEARERGLAYSVSSNFVHSPDFTEFHISTFVTPENSNELFSLFATKLRRLIEEGVSASELEDAKSLIRGRMQRAYKTPGQLVGWYDEEYLKFGEVNELRASLDELQEVSATEIKQIAGKLFSKPIWGVSFVGNIDTEGADKLRGILAKIWQ